MPPARFFFTFQGRMQRLPYLGWNLAVVLGVGVLCALVIAALGVDPDKSGPDAYVGLLLVLALGFAVICANLSLMVRRLHDIGMSGWHVLWIVAVSAVANVLEAEAPDHPLTLAAIVGSVLVALWILLMPGEPKLNRFGPPAMPRITVDA